MQRTRIHSPDSFVASVRTGGPLLDDLLAEVTTGESYFFREHSHFAFLRQTVLPGFRARRLADQKFRAWSAGCSTGEEAYSLAIALREETTPASIVGTDISRTRLAAARRGVYRKWSFRGVSADVIARYFAVDGESLTLAPEIRRDAEFRYLNLAADSFPSMSTGVWGMDFILCRNVLIYFDPETIARVAEALLCSLSEDGYLVLSATDPPLHDIAACEVVPASGLVAYRRLAAAGRSRNSKWLPLQANLPAAGPLSVATVPPNNASLRLDEQRHGIGLPSRRSEPSGNGARDAYKARDYARTAALVDSAAVRGEHDIDDLIVGIRALANLGRLEEAGRACATALDWHRDNAQLHYIHSILVAQAGLREESARAAKRAIYLDRSMIVAHLALGTALAGTPDQAGAQRAFGVAERMLAEMPPSDEVPHSDGEPAGRLLELARAQARLAVIQSSSI